MLYKTIEKTSTLFKYIAILYVFVSVYYFMNLPSGGGDESLFISDLQLIKNMGWHGAIVKNISIPYMLLVYPLSFIMEEYIALRMINIGLVLLLFLYFYYIDKIRSKSTYYYLLFFISTVGYFYFGTNDCLFFVSLIVFFNEVNNTVIDKNKNYNLALTALIIAFFTRQLFLVYFPIIILGIYILHKSGFRITTKSLVPLTVFIVFIFLNFPSIEQNGTLSFDKKEPPKELGVTWSQRQYLAQLMVNKGQLENGQHPSWEDTKKYLEKNGKKSLPDGILNGITLDYKLTITEFFKDFAYSMIYSSRSLGLMLFFTLLYWFKGIKNNLNPPNIKFELKYFVPFATLIMVMIFSFIIISNVELRWLSPVFVMTIVYYSELEQDGKFSKYFIHVNYIILCLLSVYGIFRIFNKI